MPSPNPSREREGRKTHPSREREGRRTHPSREREGRSRECEGEAHNTPFVLGIASALRASISTAWRSARARPLNALSAMW